LSLHFYKMFRICIFCPTFVPLLEICCPYFVPIFAENFLQCYVIMMVVATARAGGAGGYDTARLRSTGGRIAAYYHDRSLANTSQLNEY
jgi:hypothetical protein